MPVPCRSVLSEVSVHKREGIRVDLSCQSATEMCCIIIKLAPYVQVLAIATYNHYKRVDHEERRKSRAKAAAAPAESADSPPGAPQQPPGARPNGAAAGLPSAHADIRPSAA